MIRTLGAIHVEVGPQACTHVDVTPASLSPIFSRPRRVDSSAIPGEPATSLEMLFTPSEVLVPAGAQCIVAFLFELLPIVCFGSRNIETGNVAPWGCKKYG